MYLKLSEEAKVTLQKYTDEHATIILDLDDGVGTYSKMGVCSLDTSFRILILDQAQEKKDYQKTITSDIGEVKIKDYSDMYMDEEMELSFDSRLHVFSLKSPSGVLDAHVPVVDLRTEKVRD
ncbi:MAG: iron-sulfur cluster biosynthesis family protein [Enterococcus sp.]